MCVDEEHVRALADQAAEWHKPGIKPVGSAGKDLLEVRAREIMNLFVSSCNGTYCQQTGSEDDVEK